MILYDKKIFKLVCSFQVVSKQESIVHCDCITCI